MGRGWDHFRDVGTLLVNETDEFSDPYRKEAFDLWPTMENPKKGKERIEGGNASLLPLE